MFNKKNYALSILLVVIFLNACKQAVPLSPNNKTGPGSQQATIQAPAELYRQYCANCHEGGTPKAPHSVTFQLIGPEAILSAMNTGVMQQQADQLTMSGRRILAEYLGGRSLYNNTRSNVAACTETDKKFDLTQPPEIMGWGMDLENSRFIPADIAGLDKADIPRLRLKWSFAYPNATRARSQPAIAGNTIFVGSQDGTLYALDFETGCSRWTYKADAEIRSAISISQTHADRKTDQQDQTAYAYFGDFAGNVYAVNASSGKLAWKTNLEDHPDVTITGSPKLYKNRIYVPMSSSEWASAADPAYACCTFRGGVAALDATNGRLIWKNYSIPETPRLSGEKNSYGTPLWGPAGAPVWNSPTIDEKRNRLYIGTGEAYTSPAADTSDSVIAFNLDTGAIEWVHQAIAGDAWNMSCFIGEAANCPKENGPDFDIGAPPILLNLSNGRDIILVGQKSGYVYALDPENSGALIWKKRVGLGGYAGGVHWGMAAAVDILFAPVADTNFINKWQGERKPGLNALNAETGEIIWHSPATNVCAKQDMPACDPGLSAAATAIPGAVFAGAFDGHLRAYDDRTGEVIWDFNTAQEFKTLSGEMAKGGSIESDGPVIFHGHVLINSGYLFGGRMVGNVLLLFSVDGA